METGRSFPSRDKATLGSFSKDDVDVDGNEKAKNKKAIGLIRTVIL